MQGEEVLHNVGQGVIITNGSLVLQKVTRDQAGSYTCEASNVEGDEVSKPVAITIMCKWILLVAEYTESLSSCCENISISNSNIEEFL